MYIHKYTNGHEYLNLKLCRFGCEFLFCSPSLISPSRKFFRFILTCKKKSSIIFDIRSYRLICSILSHKKVVLECFFFSLTIIWAVFHPSKWAPRTTLACALIPYFAIIRFFRVPVLVASIQFLASTYYFQFKYKSYTAIWVIG